MRTRRAPSFVFLVAVGATACSDLFHGTSWSSLCDTRPDDPRCASTSASATGGGAVGGAGGSGGATNGTTGGTGGLPLDGSSADRAGASCDSISKAGFAHGDDSYWIDPAGAGASGAIQVYCSMTNGGWTLVGVVSSLGSMAWGATATWSDASTFGASDAASFNTDMKNEAWGSLSASEILFENASGATKTGTLPARSTMMDLFGKTDRVSLQGRDKGWVYGATSDAQFFAEIQNPPASPGINLAPRNACVLSMSYDSYVFNGQADDEVEGYGCVPGPGGPNGTCYAMSCGDTVRHADLRIFVR